jgi:RNA polymerase sigma factor (sigma-70 family)
VRNAAFARLGQFLLRIAYSRLKGQPGLRQTAEDCAQQALFTVWQKLSEGKGPDNSEFFMSWCASIVIHKVLDELRKIGRADAELLADPSAEEEDRFLQLPDPGALAPETHIIELESKRAFVNLIQNHRQLVPEGKFVLLYGYLLEWNDDALAQHLNKKRSSIRVLRFRTLQTLRGDPEFMQSLADLALPPHW